MSTRLVLLSAALLAIAASSLAFTAGRRPAAPPTAVIAVIDLEKVLNALDEKTVKQAEFKGKITELQKKIDDLEKQIVEKRKAMEVLPAGEKKPAWDELRRLVIEYDFEKKFSLEQLNELEGDMLRALYQKIDAAAEAIARKNGYTIVLASDEKVEVKAGKSEDVQRTISLKRMLYVDSRHDISDEIVTLMNNEYASQKNAPPPPASAAPPAAGSKPAAPPSGKDANKPAGDSGKKAADGKPDSTKQKK